MSDMEKNVVDEMKENVEKIKNELENNIAKEDNKEDKKEESKKDRIVKEFLSWVKVFVVAIIISFIISNFVIINANVPTGSMKKLIQPGDRMIGLRLAYTFGEPERGDIVIFKFPDNENEIYVKRLIGLPGDTVTIKDCKVYINDSEIPLEEDYLPEEWTVMNGTEEEGGVLVYEVPEDSYFMLGDNRNVSYDARYWDDKYVSKDQIVAKALFSYWPTSNAKILKSAEYSIDAE